MRKKPWLRLIAVIATAGILSSASSAFAQGLPQQPAGQAEAAVSPEAAPVYQKWQELPQNIQALMPQLEQADVIVPSDDPYELTVKHPDGTYTTEVYAVPVKYQDSQGETQYVDTSLQTPSLLKRMFSSQAYTNKEGYVALTYPTEISKGVQVDGAFTWSIPEQEQQDKADGTTTPEGSGKVVYSEAFGENTYVEYINTYAGFKENIVLEKNIGQNTFDFVFESDEYMPVLVDESRAIEIVLKSDPGQSEYTISPLYVYDSFDPTTSDNPYSHKHWTDNCHYDIIPQQEGRYIIRAVVSEDFLNHPETVYPVTIDPSLNTSSAASNVEDGFVKESDKKGYGKYDYLQFGYLNGKIYSYVKFINLPQFPAGSYFTGATFKVTFRTGQNTPANMKATVKECNKDFSESTLNWNNKPTGKTALSSVLPKITNGYLDYYNFTVTGAVRNWYTKYTNYGLVFDYQNETYSDYNSVVSSEGDAARAPKLTINYAPKTNATSGITNDGYYFIRNRASGKCLSIPGDYLYVDQESYKGTANQLWKVHYNGDGSYAISSPARPGYYLYAGSAVDKGTVALYYETGTLSDDCRFLILTTSKGDFRLTSRTTSPLWAMTAGRTSSSTVETYTYTAVTDQQWYFQKYSLSLSASKSQIEVGDTLRINPSTNALPLTWSTSDSKVATVSGGLVTARGVGTATITAKASNGIKTSYTITILAKAIQLKRGIAVNGNIGKGGECWYKFTPTEKTNYKFYSTGSTDTYGELYQGSVLLQSDNDSGENSNFNISYTLSPGKEYRLKVKGDTSNISGTFSVGVVANVQNSNKKEDIISRFNNLLGSGKKTPAHIYTTEECINIIFNYDEYIVTLCNTTDFEMPKAFVQALLMRELWCVNATDTAADLLVSSGINEDSSTGYGQIFASTAIQALNFVNSIGMTTGMASMDVSNPEDIKQMWNNLHNDQYFNIKMVYYEVLNCTNKTCQPNRLLWEYTESQIKAVLSRYNGTGDAAKQYGDEVYQYYLIFDSFN